MPGALRLVRPKSVPVFGTCSCSLVDGGLAHVCNVTVGNTASSSGALSAAFLRSLRRQQFPEVLGSYFPALVFACLTPHPSEVHPQGEGRDHIHFCFSFLLSVFSFIYILVSEREGEEERGGEKYPCCPTDLPIHWLIPIWNPPPYQPRL